MPVPVVNSNKKLCCRWETARCFGSLNILLSHSMSFEMTMLSRAWVGPYWYVLLLCPYVVLFMRYSTSKNGVTLKLGIWRCSIPVDHILLYDFLLVGHCKYSCMLYNFQVIWRWIIVTLKRSLKVIQTGTIQKLGCGFLFAFHSNYGHVFNRLWDIQHQSIAWPWKLG